MSGKRISFLVTGGAGFVGSNMVQKLVEYGFSVRVIDDFSTGKRENIAGFAAKVEILDADIRCMAAVRKAVEGVNYVLHLAALPSVHRSVEDPITTNEVNVNGTLNLLIAARDAKVKRLIYAGSSSAYGSTKVLPKKENITPNPMSPYAAQKLMGEYYCKIFKNIYGLETVILRYFNIFGPRQDCNSSYSAVIPRFITALMEGNPPTVFGDGRQSRDFTYVDNAVLATISAAFAPNASGEIINVACGERVALSQVIQNLKEILNSDIAPIYEAPRPGDVQDSLADITKARKLLGYEPTVRVMEGLKKTVEFYTGNGPSAIL